MFAREAVPEYEITQATVEQLWQLASDSQEREKRVETIVEDLEQKTQEYTAESEECVCTYPIWH